MRSSTLSETRGEPRKRFVRSKNNSKLNDGTNFQPPAPAAYGTASKRGLKQSPPFSFGLLIFPYLWVKGNNIEKKPVGGIPSTQETETSKAL